MSKFGLYAIKVMQDLLKIISDKNDADTFNAVARELSRLFRYFRERHRDDRFGAELPGQDQRRTRAVVASEIANELDLAINQVLLALGGRILTRRLDRDFNAAPQLNGLFPLLPSTLKALTLAYAEASSFRAGDYWGWNTWDILADGEAQWIDSHTNLNRLFVLCSLKLLAAMPDAARQAVVLPRSHSLAEMAREDNDQGALVVIEDIEEHPERWDDIVGAAERDQIQRLKELLRAARLAEAEADEERTRNAPLDPERLAAFNATVLQSFKESGRLRELFKLSNAFKNRIEERPGEEVRALGYKQLDDKGAYIAQEHTSYFDWGRAYGDGLGRAETEEAFSTIVEGAGEAAGVPAD
jgi:hypothetical protein